MGCHTKGSSSAICMALRLAKSYGLQVFILESDCKAITSRLLIGSIFQFDIDTIIEDALF